MKVRIVAGGYGIEFVPETAKEEAHLAETYKGGHVHYVCKAFMKAGTKRKALLLTPSFQDFKAVGLRRADRKSQP
jgi:intracellular sulfur oxidation DsrE/DsrF family protein